MHCDKGGIKAEAELMTPDDYRRYSEELKPGVCQLSGGEPLLRDDLVDIVKAVKRPNGLPLVVLVSNWWLMTEEKYLALNEAGVSLFSISLDFPDERHDDFRDIPGLYAKMSEMIPYLVKKYGRDNIVLNSALTHANFDDDPGTGGQGGGVGHADLVQRLQRASHGRHEPCASASPRTWRCCASTSTTSRSTGATSATVMNSDWILEQTYRFFAEGGMRRVPGGAAVHGGAARRAVQRLLDVSRTCSTTSRKEAVEGLQVHPGELRPVLRGHPGRHRAGAVEPRSRTTWAQQVGNTPGLGAEGDRGR